MYDSRWAMIVDEIPDEERKKLDKKIRGKKKEKFSLKWLVIILLGVAIALSIKHFLIYKVKVSTGSMLPTIENEEQILVTRVYNLKNLKRGDILVFESKEYEDIFIKRLIGLPGDNVKIMDGKVSVNGEQLDESYVKSHDDDYGDFIVPEGKYFFLGDNRPESWDSRKWVNTYIDGSDIKGKAIMKVYPFRHFGKIE
ncbi:signal peptidase I [Clostridium sp. SHJSY1]|uniref:signal peptidase I n=1 Tax=Clostridium sp. SHJSY1 TaxID=2942483 RepID=UPI00287451F0|nr:signal peptidase I [Clostridium sp. SHJSY1]MDS0526954.1 signal peptidase I [Clostridium sp. SHJSY1]